MKANELRIGNIIKLLATGFETTVDLLLFKDIYDDESFLDYLQGIPLTEDRLMKFGFEKRGSEYILEIESEDTLFIIEYFEYTKAYHFTAGEGCRYGKGCKYIHELQNLYFTLTGLELSQL